MPTYKFHCDNCQESWTVLQPLLLDGSTHTSPCPKCNEACENTAFGGSGFQFAGKHMNKRLKGFPDNSSKINRGAAKDAEQMEKIHDAKQREDSKE